VNFKAIVHSVHKKISMLNEHHVELYDDYREFEIQRAHYDASLASSVLNGYFPTTSVRYIGPCIDYEIFLGPIGLWDWAGDSYWDVNRASLL